MNRKYSILSNIWFAISIQFRAAPIFTAYRFFYAVFADVVTLFEHTFLLAYIVSCVEQGKALSDILKFLIPVAVCVIYKVVVDPWINSYIAPKSNAKIKKLLHLKLYEKAVSMEISKYDDSEFYNDFVWAMQQAPDYIGYAADALRSLLSNIAIVLITGVYIASTDAFAFITVAVILAVSYVVQLVLNKLNMKLEEALLPIRRKRDYVNRVFYLADFAKDLKMSDMASKYEKDFEVSSNEMISVLKKRIPKMCVFSFVGENVQSLVYDGIYMTYLFWQALVNGKYGLGSLLGLYNTSSRLSNTLRRIIMMLPNFQNHSLYITKLRTFLDTENEMPDDGKKATPASGDIGLDNVVFTYPGNSEPTLNGVSMNIKKGEKIALVGFNGAGKSTLIKLMLRLYDPDSGSVRFADNDIKDYPLSEYRDRFGVLFQDFEIIATDLGHNINMSDNGFDEQKADSVLKKAAFWERFQTLPNGYKTQLTKEFDDSGVNLSGGEAQKVALARVLYSDSGVIILDEPSAALDPIAEYQLNKTVTELAEDKTVIIISHRLSTTRFVDKIYMLENGRIIEQGTHDDLLVQNGKYAEMFALQAEKYS